MIRFAASASNAAASVTWWIYARSASRPMTVEWYAVITDRLAACRSRCYWMKMQFNLEHHPTTPPTISGLKVWATLEHAASLAAVATTNIWFGIGASADKFVIPEV